MKINELEPVAAALEQAVENIRNEIRAVLDAMPPGFYIQVREGGGPEDLLASLAVSVAKLKLSWERQKVEVSRLEIELESLLDRRRD